MDEWRVACEAAVSACLKIGLPGHDLVDALQADDADRAILGVSALALMVDGVYLFVKAHPTIEGKWAVEEARKACIAAFKATSLVAGPDPVADVCHIPG